MAITYSEKLHTFQLDGKSFSYVIGVYPEHMNFIQHLYFGAKIPVGENLRDMNNFGWHASFEAEQAEILELDPPEPFFTDVTGFEYPTPGTGDHRDTALCIRNKDGNSVTDIRYTGYKIYKGKNRLTNLPSLYGTEEDCETLELYAKDYYTGAEVTLIYTVFEGSDALVRSAKVRNGGKDALKLENCASLSFDLKTMDFDFIHLWGQHNQERNLSRTPLQHGTQSIDSKRGASGHYHNPFIALAKHNADERSGEVYGINFVYSGNFRISAEVTTLGTTRVMAGINPFEFRWNLLPGEEFQSPECVAVYSDEGLGGMSRTFHRLYLDHLIPERWAYTKRPLLINSWEAATFDFDTEKLISFAETVKDLGIEMLVMDDGWFGHRDNDRSSLGDWYIYEGKLDLKKLTDKVHGMGMKFGIWYEPEMISPNSDLFRAHPDWHIHVPGRPASQGRYQYVLDFSRKDVRDNIFDQMSAILDNYDIDYVKWDFNRNVTEAGSALLDADHAGEFFHRYMLGLYEFLERFTEKYPDILLESCSGGGGRFDAGWLCYSPQIWTSDNTNPVCRVRIQYGTSLCYPTSAMGSHVSHKDRAGDYKFRGTVAMAGTFGYEMDPRTFTEEERELVRQQVSDFHKYYDMIHYGDLYRLITPYDGDASRCVWSYVSRDKSECLMTALCYRHGFEPNFLVRMQGLDATKTYYCEKLNLTASGARLMNAGINFNGDLTSEGCAKEFYFKEVK